MTLRNKIVYNFGGLLPFPTFHYGRSAPGYSLVSSLQNFRKGYRYYPCPIAFDTTSSRRTYGTPVTPVSLFQQSYSLFETSALRMHRRPFSFASYTLEHMRRRCISFVTKNTNMNKSVLRRCTNFIIDTTANTLKRMRRRCISFVTENTNMNKSVLRRCTNFIIDTTANTLKRMRRRCISFVTENTNM